MTHVDSSFLFSHMNDNELHSQTIGLVARERLVTTSVLHALNEIELRRLHLERGFKSLHEFVVSLGYSDGAAHRRISAARLVRSQGEVELSLKDGRLNLTTAAAVQDFLVSEKRDFKKSYSFDQRRHLLKSVESKSRTECEQIFQKLSPKRALKPRPEKVIIMAGPTAESPSLEVRFNLSPELQRKLNEVKALYSHHQKAHEGYASLMELMADLLTKRKQPKQSKEAEKSIELQTTEETTNGLQIQERDHGAQKDILKAMPSCRGTPLEKQRQVSSVKTNKPNRYIPEKIKRQVYLQHDHRCSFIDPQTKRRCSATKHLEIDHRIPLAMNGSSNQQNLRILCSNHNKLAAVQAVGPRTMAQFMRI